MKIIWNSLKTGTKLFSLPKKHSIPDANLSRERIKHNGGETRTNFQMLNQISNVDSVFPMPPIYNFHLILIRDKQQALRKLVSLISSQKKIAQWSD